MLGTLIVRLKGEAQGDPGESQALVSLERGYFNLFWLILGFPGVRWVPLAPLAPLASTSDCTLFQRRPKDLRFCDFQDPIRLLICTCF